MRNIVVFGGSSHPELVQSICERLAIPPAQAILGQFSNKETSVQIMESVRDLDVFIIQTAAGHVNNHLMELMIMIAACKMASARRITVVLPCFPYSRQPDVPYKRGGLPRRIMMENASTVMHGSGTSGDKTSVSAVDAPAAFASAGSSTKVAANPVAAQLQKQLEERQQAKMKRLHESNVGIRKSFSGAQTPAMDTLSAASSASNSSPHSPDRENTNREYQVTSPLAQEPIFSSGVGSNRSRSPARDRKVVELRRLEMTEAVSEEDQGRVTIISSPMVTQASALGLPKGSYRHWTARSGTLIANLLVAAGTNHLITMDLHDPQFQGFFDIPVDNLSGSPLMVKYIREKFPDYKKAVIVSPDAGGAKRAANIAHKLGMEFALIHKERKYHHMHNQNASHNNSQLFGSPVPSRSLQQQQEEEMSFKQQMLLVGNVQDKTCILIDDIADTSNTITKAAQLLNSKGAKKIFAIVTHGILSGSAVQRLKASPIDQIIVSDTVPQTAHVKELGSRIRVFEVAPILAEAIRRIHHGESVSYLFEPVDI